MVSLLSFLSGPAMPQVGRMQYGELKIIPGLTLQGLHDDNIYLGSGSNTTTEAEESDWITHVIPSLLLDYVPERRGSLKLGYQGDFAYYSDNDDNDWQTHKGMLDLNYQAPGGLMLGIDNIYTDAEDPYGSLEQYEIGLKTERWSNDLKGKIGYDFSDKFKLFGYYNFYKQDYADDDKDYTQDYKSNEFGLGAQMRVMPKTWGFVRYHLGGRDYFTHPAEKDVDESKDSDFDWQRVNAGLTWDTGVKLTGELNFGYEWKDYENATDVDGDKYDDKNTWIASTRISFKATPATTLALSIQRALREAGSNTNEYFEDTGIGINLKQTVLTKVTLFVGGVYSKNDYNVWAGKSRDDDNYEANTRLDYRIQDWLTAGIGYTYREKDSDSKEDEFTDNQFMISLSAVY